MQKPKKSKSKKYFDVYIETLLPSTLIYKVYAESPEEAAELIRNLQPNAVKPRLVGKKDIKLIVYESGCKMILFMKNLIGIR